MRLPHPRVGETRHVFVKRCMGDPTMLEKHARQAERQTAAERLWSDAQQLSVEHMIDDRVTQPSLRQLRRVADVED